MKSASSAASDHYLAKAIEFGTRGLSGLPPSAAKERGVLLNRLAVYYSRSGALEKSLLHIRDAITAFDQCEMRLQAARARYVAAQSLQQLRRYQDALEYARSARSALQRLTRLDAEGDALCRAVEAKIGELEESR
jgi:hypothetical protein